MLVGATVAGMADGDPARWADDRGADGAGGGRHVRPGVGAAAELARQLHQRNDPARLQGGRGADDRDDAAAQAVRRQGRRRATSSSGSPILAGQLPDTNVAVLAFGLVALALLLAGEKLLPGRPVALLVVAVSIVALSVTSLADLGFTIVGELPKGLPDFRLPELRLRDVDGVIPLAFACLLLAYVEGVSAARTLAQKNGYAIDPRQELLGLGAANLAAAFSQGYPVAGGLSQSSVNDKAGAKTPLALVFASVTIGLCLMYPDRPAAQPAQRRAGGDRARRRQGPDQRPRAAPPVAREPLRIRRLDGRFRRRAAARDPERRDAGGASCRCCSSSGAPRIRMSPSSAASRARAVSPTWSATRITSPFPAC